MAGFTPPEDIGGRIHASVQGTARLPIIGLMNTISDSEGERFRALLKEKKVDRQLWLANRVAEVAQRAGNACAPTLQSSQILPTDRATFNDSDKFDQTHGKGAMLRLSMNFALTPDGHGPITGEPNLSFGVATGNRTADLAARTVIPAAIEKVTGLPVETVPFGLSPEKCLLDGLTKKAVQAVAEEFLERVPAARAIMTRKSP